MNHLDEKIRHRPAPKSAQGMTLVEVMVAIVVMSLGLLGIAGLQAATAKYKINTWARSSVSALLSDLSERVRVNPDVAGPPFTVEGVDSTSGASKYVIDVDWNTQQSTTLGVTQNCETTACTASERATSDLLVWRQRVRNSLPQGAALISGDRKDGLTVTMMWFDKEQVNARATLVSAPTCLGSERGMAQQTCCPPAAAVPAGVRCANFSFIP